MIAPVSPSAAACSPFRGIAESGLSPALACSAALYSFTIHCPALSETKVVSALFFGYHLSPAGLKKQVSGKVATCTVVSRGLSTAADRRGH